MGQCILLAWSGGVSLEQSVKPCSNWYLCESAKGFVQNVDFGVVGLGGA